MNRIEDEIHLVYPGIDLHIQNNTKTIGNLKRIIDEVLLDTPETKLNLEGYQGLSE